MKEYEAIAEELSQYGIIVKHLADHEDMPTFAIFKSANNDMNPSETRGVRYFIDINVNFTEYTTVIKQIEEKLSNKTL